MLIFRQKYFQYCTPSLENSTTRITIVLCLHRLTYNSATQIHQRPRLEYLRFSSSWPSQSSFYDFFHIIRSFFRIVLDCIPELNSGLHDREFVSTVAAGAQTCRFHRLLHPQILRLLIILKCHGFRGPELSSIEQTVPADPNFLTHSRFFYFFYWCSRFEV